MKNDRLPIGIFTDERKTGGTFVLAEKLANQIQGKLIILSSNYSAETAENFYVRVVKLFNKRIFLDLRSLFSTDEKISLWHIHYPTPILLPLFILSRKPKIITYHYRFLESPFLLPKKNVINKIVNLIFFIPLNALFLNIHLFSCNKVTFLTKAQSADFRKVALSKRTFDRKIAVVGNFIEKDLIKVSNHIESKKNRILFVGRYTNLKGFHDLIEISKNIPEAHFTIIGDSNFSTVQKNITNLGRLPHEKIIEQFDANDIFFLPSYTEVFPMTILEAMARGLAVLISDLPGISEIVEDGTNGYLFKPGDRIDIENKIRQLIFNSDEIQRISKNNLSRAEDFTAVKQIKEYLDIYEEVVKG